MNQDPITRCFASVIAISRLFSSSSPISLVYFLAGSVQFHRVLRFVYSDWQRSFGTGRAGSARSARAAGKVVQCARARKNNQSDSSAFRDNETV